MAGATTKGRCDGMTGWRWHGETEKWGTSVVFNLAFTIKAGFVVRAIVSAGGLNLESDTHPTWEMTDKKLYKYGREQVQTDMFM